MQRIHLLWTGPHTFMRVREMVGNADYGVYQIYGPHPASGRNTLLYIGRAANQTFGWRFANADKLWCSPEDPWNDNVTLLRIFTGRVHLTQDEQDRGGSAEEFGEKYIKNAERLLVATHSPPWNAQGVGGIKGCPSSE